MRRNARPRRHRVALRPKVRGQKTRQAAAAAALALLGGAAAATLSHLSSGPNPWLSLKASLQPNVAVVEVRGIPDVLARRIEAALAAGGSRPESDWAKDALARFGYLKSFSCRRTLRGPTVCSASLRAAVAAAAGRSRSFLGDDGTIFDAPEEFPGVTGPLLEPGRASAQELARLAVFLSSHASSFPSPLERLTYASPQDGWRLKLQDGTTVLFGDMRWGGEKVQRLGQVLGDARSEFSAKAVTADLRYFEDGRILLRPMAAR